MVPTILPSENLFNGGGVLSCCCFGRGGDASSTEFLGLDIKFKRAIPCGTLITSSGLKLKVILDVTNSNCINLRTTGFTYKLANRRKREGKDGAGSSTIGPVFAEGSIDGGIDLPKDQTTELVVPVTCSYSGVGSLGKNMVTQNEIKFTMSGKIHYKVPMTGTSRSLPYRTKGTFSVLSSPSKDKLLNKKSKKEQPKDMTTKTKNKLSTSLTNALVRVSSSISYQTCETNDETLEKASAAVKGKPSVRR